MSRFAVLALAVASAAAAQTKPSFEVVSIKPHKADDNRMGFPQFQPGRFTATGVPVRILITTAYGLGFQSLRLSGGPDWLMSRDSTYDVEATFGRDALPAGLSEMERTERTRAMLQALLADRFHLKIRRETKEMPAYAVIIGKGGPKLTKSKIEEKDCPADDGPPVPNGVRCHSLNGGRGRGLHGEAVTISDVINAAENWSDHPMVDKTGLQGLFNVQTSGWTPMQPGPPPAPGTKGEDGSDAADIPSLFTVFERLGLKLEAQKLAIETFVIESIEKPAGN